jgi:hypothetical protein
LLGADKVQVHSKKNEHVDKFEQQISRIHELLEGAYAEVTWNDAIIDPDNPKRFRQIDATIKKAGKLTLIECRIHYKPQNVKWIEELIGRRISLRADHVIGVSSAGFTKGACLKAAKHGIMLRDLRSLTDAEVLQWDRSVEVTLLFYQYSNIEITFLFNSHYLPLINVADLSVEFSSSPLVATVFNHYNCTCKCSKHWPGSDKRAESGYGQRADA